MNKHFQLVSDLLASNRAKIDDLCIEIAVSDSSKADMQSSAWVDLDHPMFMGRVSFWKNGKADLEIINVETEENVYWAHCDELSFSAADEWLNRFYQLVKSQDKRPSL